MTSQVVISSPDAIRNTGTASIRIRRLLGATAWWRDVLVERVDLKTGCIRLAAKDVKQERAMVIPMTTRVLEALRAVPRHLGVEWVFLSTRPPKPGEKPKPWNDIGWMFDRAITKAGMLELWFHYLRRSFVTKARRQKIPESKAEGRAEESRASN